MRRIGFLVGGLVVLVGAFLIANWILSMNGGLNWKFTDEASLDTVAKAAGYRLSPGNFIGHVEIFKRIDNGNVSIGGWALDLSNDGSPINLTAFISGRAIASFHTDGDRVDIIEAVRKTPTANPASAKNTLFASRVSCTPGDKVFVVATTASKNYLLLEPQPLICP
jgi:hypothetical protein